MKTLRKEHQASDISRLESLVSYIISTGILKNSDWLCGSVRTGN